jgi:hypothetical protein
MRKVLGISASAVIITVLFLCVVHASMPLTPVFDGKSLSGWHTLGGADWRVDHGDLVGTVGNNSMGGWIILDTVYGTGEVDVLFECKNCEPSVLIRAGKVGDRPSGVDISLSGADAGTMFRVNLDDQGKAVRREPMPSFGGEFGLSEVPANYLITGGCAPIPCAGIKDAHGGGIGTPGMLGQQTKLGLVPSGVNKLVITMGDDTLAGTLNGARLHGAKMDGGKPYGQIALHVAGVEGSELRVKSIAVRDYTARKADLAPEIMDSNFRMQQLTDIFYAEGAAVGDINRDGKMDVVAGPFYYLGPDFKEAHEIYPPATINVGGAEYPGGPPVPQSGMVTHGNYPPSFMSWVYDFNGDGWPDVLMVMAFGPRPTFSAHVFINPKGEHRHWDNYEVVPLITNEANQWVDVDGDGKPELTGQLATRADWSDAQVGYWKPDWSNPTKPWTFMAVSEKGRWSGHGLATGDVNGDGRLDLVSPAGWWEQPPKGAQGFWKYRPAHLGNGGAEMFVYDVNGDGIPDIITSLAAHGPGLSWFEQKKDGSFQEHLIMGAPSVPLDQRKNWEETDKNVAFTELHSMSLADIDGDGLKDIITGKRWYSHGYHYDDEDDISDPPVLYVFKLVRKAGNQVEWVPELVHNRTDAAIQIAIADVDGDGRPDIVTSGRKGTFIFFNKTGLSSSRANWTVPEWCGMVCGSAAVVVLIVSLMVGFRRTIDHGTRDLVTRLWRVTRHSTC